MYFVLCLFGLFLAIAGVTMFVLGVTTANWPTVSGKVLSASVHASTSTKAPKTYSAALAYEYTVDGKTYLGTFTRIGGLGFAHEPAAEQYIDGKRKEAAIPVYYFPLYPALAVIERGFSSAVWIFVFAGMGFFLIFRLLGGGLRCGRADDGKVVLMRRRHTIAWSSVCIVLFLYPLSWGPVFGLMTRYKVNSSLVLDFYIPCIHATFYSEFYYRYTYACVRAFVPSINCIPWNEYKAICGEKP